MKNIIAVMLATVIGATLIPTVTSSVDDADIFNQTETFVATEDNTVAESFTLENSTINDEVEYVNVNDSALDSADYTVTGSDVELVADASTTDDNVEINYDYEGDLGVSQNLIDLLPLLFITIIILGIVGAMRMKN